MQPAAFFDSYQSFCDFAMNISVLKYNFPVRTCKKVGCSKKFCICQKLYSVVVECLC